MPVWVLSAGFAAALGGLIFSCISSRAAAIQADLSSRTVAALASENIHLGPDFVMDGRDAWLTGSAPTEEARGAAGRAAASVPGVRMVHNLLKVDPSAASVAPAAPRAEVEAAAAPQPEPAKVEPPPQPEPEPVRAEPPQQPKPAPPAAERSRQPEPARSKPAPKPAAAPATASTSEVQRSIDELIAGRVIEFESGSDRLTQKGGAIVDEMAALLGRFPDARIAIAGHTDSQGTSRNNLIMSQRRAQAVRRRLAAGGVAESRLSAQGYGEDRPIASNGTAEGRLRNRRVEFTVQ